MNGGDKILNRIKSDCDESIRLTESQSQAVCDKILSDAKAEADRLTAEADEKAKLKVEQINASSKSRAQLEIRNALLKKRRQEIDFTVDAIKEYLVGLDDREYFEVIYSLAKKLSGRQGEILLNARDKKRLPRDFEQRLKDAGLNTVISDKTADIFGGFILKCGDIEENMDFAAMIAANRDRLEDLINRELFAE